MHLFLRGLQHQTQPLPLENPARWKDLDWSFRLPVNEPLTFELWWWKQGILPGAAEFLAPWLRIHTLINTMDRALTHTLPYGELRIQYHAQRKYDPKYEGILLAGKVIAMEICFTFGPNAFWNAFATMERHQIVARIRVGPPTQTPLAQQYLGRAQLVQTLEFARHRIYKWLARAPDEAVCGSSPRDSKDWESHAREASQLQRISGRRGSVYVTPRPHASCADEEMDNDAFSNPRRMLPLVLRPQDGGIKVQLFNLGTDGGDVPYADSCYLRWESFGPTKGGAGSLTTDLTPHMKLTIYFSSEGGGGEVQITSLVLDARDYSQAFCHMGQSQGAKTI
jgi:hypothetical protein